MAAHIETLPEPDPDQLPDDDWALRGRYEITSDGQLIVMLDTMRGAYSVEWYTDMGLERFVETTIRTLPVYGNTPAFCMVSQEGQHDKTVRSALEEVTQEEGFPDSCTYLQLDVESEGVSVGWAQEDPRPTIVMTVRSEDTDVFETLFQETVGSELAPSSDIGSAIDKTRQRIQADL